MEFDNIFKEITEITSRYSQVDGLHATHIDGLHCYRMSELNIKLPVIYRPSMYVVLQGTKQTILNEEILKYTQGQYLAVAVDLPLIGEVTKASKSEPYLCIQIDIDIQTMTEIAIKLNEKLTLPSKTEKGIFVGDMDDKLINAIVRLMRLLDNPEDIPYLRSALFEEIYYRILSGPNGMSIIQTCLLGNNMQRIAKVIKTMKVDIAKPIKVDELATIVSMSSSNFYSQFKHITGFSPLQYLKRLRLTEARQIMLSENKDATSTAYLVGYESPSQFNREYARLFGAPPQRDVKEFRKLITNK